jgi:hypothetical protein
MNFPNDKVHAGVLGICLAGMRKKCTVQALLQTFLCGAIAHRTKRINELLRNRQVNEIARGIVLNRPVGAKQQPLFFVVENVTVRSIAWLDGWCDCICRVALVCLYKWQRSKLARRRKPSPQVITGNAMPNHCDDS